MPTKPSASERLAQEDKILREIRLSLATFRAVDPAAVPRRKGVAYASAPVTSGNRLYNAAYRNGFVDVSEFRRAMPELFQKEVFLPNLHAGRVFGTTLLRNGWAQVIVPHQFFAEGWTQEHYMSLWRQVIVRHTRTVAFADDWEWSLGCTEEFVIAIQYRKKILLANGSSMLPEVGLERIRTAMDNLNVFGFDIKPHYELWRLATLTLESETAKTS